jgi:amidohydrolase
MEEQFTTSFHEWLVQLRRDFHQFPELGYKETKTAARIAQVLEAFEVPFRAGVARTGIAAILNAKRPGPVVALRADMDGLPLEEHNDVPYRSRHQGVMHACGHDAHVTIALGVVRWLLESNWTREGSGTILFFFQPAEEAGAGARAMIEAGVLDWGPLEAIFAGHLHPELPVGHIGLAPEVSNAASSVIQIRLTGKGGHGAHPHLCTDPIVVAAHLITQLQSIVSRNIAATDSAVLTIGRVESGTAPNIIPEEAFLEGTLRTLTNATRELVLHRIKDLLSGLEAAYGVSTELSVSSGYPLLVNDRGLVQYVVRLGGEFLGSNNVHLELPRMGAEDFAYFLEKCSPTVCTRRDLILTKELWMWESACFRFF